MSVSFRRRASISSMGQDFGGEIPKGYGTAHFDAPSGARLDEIIAEAERLYPGDVEMQKKYRCAIFWSEVRLCRVEMAQTDSKTE